MTPAHAYSTKIVALGESGNRIGEDHPRAKLSNADVDLIRDLIDPLDGAKPLTYREVAAKFEISPGTVGDIASGRRRAAYADSWRRVPCKARFATAENVARGLNGDL